MAAIQFGNTWWGEKWLDALSGTDYENRLPRGKTYARNGSVKEVSISGHNVSARVQGSRPRPYQVRISLPEFSERHKRAVVAAIIENPYFLSQLLNRKLAPGLFEVFEGADVPLFPKAWDDISAHCSCPDWAFCCKHIAAIIYLIANEVDKNPFLLFDLHDFDIFAALKKKGFFAQKHSAVAITSAQQLILKSAPDATAELPDREREIELQKIDFSQIQPAGKELLSLLAGRPLFYLEKDFKPLLEKALTGLARQANMETRRLKSIPENYGKNRPPAVFTEFEIAISNDLELTGLKLISEQRVIAPYEWGGFSPVFQELFIIPWRQFRSHSKGVVTLALLTHFALRLIEQGAILPQLLAVEGGHRIRWLPAYITPNVVQNFDAICHLSGKELISAPYLNKQEQINTVLSGIIGKFIDEFARHINGIPDNDITRLFIKGKVVDATAAFGGREVPENIALWLSNLQIAQKNLVPIVKVEEVTSGFTLDLLVENRKEPLNEPVSLKAVLNQKQHTAIRYDVLKDVTRLADYVPEIAELLSSNGEILPVFAPSAFEIMLFRHLPTLRLLNVPVLLPKGLDHLIRPQISAKVTTSSPETAKSYLSLQNVLDFEWQVALGDQLLSRQEFVKLVRTQSGIVKLKDQFVYLDDKEIERILKSLDAGGPRLTPGEAFKSILAGEHDGSKLHLDDRVKDMIEEMLKAASIAVPAELHATLRDYQKRGFEWLARNIALGFGSLLADDMGLGKTIQIITLLLQFLKEGRLDEAPALVVVPTSLLTNWQRELEKFAPDLKFYTYHGSDRRFVFDGVHVVLATYGLLRRDEEEFSRPKWALMVVDEAQAIKNHGTAQAKAASKIKAGARIAMTGTPVENRLSEYWGIFDFLNKGYLKGSKAFHDEYAVPIEIDRNQEKLQKFLTITTPFVLRRLKSDKSIIRDLPDKVEIDQFCQLGKKQAALYQSTLDQIMQQIEGSEDIERRGLVLKLITALKQVCNHPSHFLKKQTIDPDISGKTALLITLLKTIYENEEKVLIFTQYTQMGDLLQKLITEEFAAEPLFLHGGLSRKRRDEIVDDFQTKPYVRTMLLSLKAGGTGLNLTAAQNVIHFDLWWNPAVEAQATDRAYRIGQTQNVMVHRLISRGTFEEKINDMLKDKRELAELTVAAGEKWIGDYSDKDLREIFALQ